MKILITGVAGFVGSNLAKSLLQRGHNVTGIDNLNYGFLRNIDAIKDNKNFQFFMGDIANPLILKDVKADIIIHLASQKIPRYTNALRTLEENYLMLRNVVHKCIMDKSKILFASTSDVYGKNPNVPFSENSDLVMGPTTVKRWAYALSKMYGEQYIIANHEEYGLNYTITRFFGSYGPNQNLTWWGGPQSVFIEKAFKKEAIDIHGDGLQTRTFTYVEDTVNALISCIENENSNNEIFNTGPKDNAEITIKDLAILIWKLVNGKDSEPKLNFIPYSTFGNYEDVMRRVPDITKICSKLGFKPKWDLEQGLIETINWQKQFI
ncbi:MAG: GDP-mannose 4,6-dehydratase [Ferruginibacter sp.]|nr:GDP-mannose 4,6-dehydratase [Bacteroidota bacterium]MBX2917925.1 GDP-mannose 4,6-dehydratase [Ferruginibacter sp.]MCB0709199.1 GDP-mannose 4,6-dehydratase [Chitinophagaceae bacterium]